MAEGNLKFTIEIDDKGSATIKNLDGSIEKLKNTTMTSTDVMGKSVSSLWQQVAIGSAVWDMVKGSIKEFYVDSIRKFADEQKGILLLGNAVKNAGSDFRLTTGDLVEMSEALKKTTMFTDDELIAAEGLMLRFDHISSETFPRIIGATTDLATAMGIDLRSATMMVGKAMDNPLEGMTALQRAGLRLSETEKDQIKILMEHNQGFEAQDIILKKIEKQMGGANVEAMKGLSGAFKEAGDFWDDFKKEVGKGFGELIILARDFAKSLTGAESSAAASQGVLEIQQVKFLTFMANMRKAGLGASDEYKKLAEGVRQISLAAAQERLENKLLGAIGAAPRFDADTNAAKKYADMLQGVSKGGGEMAKMLKTQTDAALKSNAALKAAEVPIKNFGVANDELAERIKKAAAEEAKLAKETDDLFERLEKLSDQGIKPAAKTFDLLKSSTEAATKELKNITGASVEFTGQFGIQTSNISLATDAQGNFKDEIIESVEGIKKQQVQTDGQSKATMNLADKITMISNAYKSFMGLLDVLGIKNDGVIAGIGETISGVATFATSLKTGDIAGMISGATQAISGLLKVFASHGEEQAITRTFQNVGGVSAELAKKMKELTKATGDAVKSSMILLDEAIREGDVTLRNFDDWTRKLSDIISQVDMGKMTKDEAGGEIGDAFTELMAKAKELGIAYSKEMINLFGYMREHGIKSKEVTEFINSALAEGSKALQDYAKDQAIGGEYADAFYAAFKSEGKSLLEIAELMGDTLPQAQRDFVNANRTTLQQVSALQKMMQSLGATGYATDKTFQQFGRDTKTLYDNMITGGATAEQALDAITPLLIEQCRLANAYGFAISAETKAWLEQQGIDWSKIKDPQTAMLDVQNQMLEVLKLIAKTFGVDIPGAMETFDAATQSAIDNAKRAIDDYGWSVQNLPIPNFGGAGAGMPGFATGSPGWIPIPHSFLVGERGPEIIQASAGKMNVRPISDDTRPRTQNNITIHITGSRNDAHYIAEQVRTALKDNLNGDLKVQIRKAVNV